MKFRTSYVMVIMLVLCALCYFVSALFFLNSGVIDHNGQLDEVRSVQILRAFDEIPFIYLNSDEVNFDIYGTVRSIDDGFFTVSDYYRTMTFYYNSSYLRLDLGDEVWVNYQYSDDYNLENIRIRKILRIEDVVDYTTCREYGGELNYDFPRKCTVGQVTFTETENEINESCIGYNGTWIAGHNQCEMISERDCYWMGGDYSECESACRHDLDNDSCIVRCVRVCRFD